MKKLIFLLLAFLTITVSAQNPQGIRNGLIFKGKLSTAPTTPSKGLVYYNDADETLYLYNGSEWVDLGASGATTIVGLTDTPADMVGAYGKVLTPNAGETDMVWTDIVKTSDLDERYPVTVSNHFAAQASGDHLGWIIHTTVPLGSYTLMELKFRNGARDPSIMYVGARWYEGVDDDVLSSATGYGSGGVNRDITFFIATGETTLSVWVPLTSDHSTLIATMDGGFEGLDKQITSIENVITGMPSARLQIDCDVTWTPLPTSLHTVGEAVSSGDLVYLNSDGKYWKTDATDEDKSIGKLAVVLELYSGADVYEIQTSGEITTTGLTAGARYYVSETSGEITNDISTFASGSIVRFVGYALSTTVLDFQPSAEYFKL